MRRPWKNKTTHQGIATHRFKTTGLIYAVTIIQHFLVYTVISSLRGTLNLMNTLGYPKSTLGSETWPTAILFFCFLKFQEFYLINLTSIYLL